MSDSDMVSAAAERNQLQQVVGKLVDAIGITVAGDIIGYAYGEYSTRCPFEPEELAAYQRAIDGGEFGTDVKRRPAP